MITRLIAEIERTYADLAEQLSDPEVLADRNERRDALDQAWTTWIGAGGDLAVPIPNAGDDVVAFVRALDLDAIMRGFGATTERLTALADVADVVEHALARRGPTVVFVERRA